MDVLANLQTSDGYTDALKLEADSADTLTFVIANASVFARLRVPPKRGGARNSYGAEFLLTPQTNSIKNVDGVQFRSAVAGAPARIVAQLTGPDDPQLAGGTPFTGQLSAGGLVNVGTMSAITTLLSTAQSIPTSSTTRLQMDTLETKVDPNNDYTFTGNHIVTNFSGIVLVSGIWFPSGGSGTGSRLLIFDRDNFEIARFYTPGALPDPTGSVIVPCVVGDVFDCWAYQDSGVALATAGARFGLARMG